MQELWRFFVLILTSLTVSAKIITIHNNDSGISESKLSTIESKLLMRLHEDLPGYVLPPEAFILRNNKIKSIPKDFFNFVSELIYLDLGNNGIETVDEGSFRNLRNLKFMNISRNKLVELQSDTFADLVSLKYLKLDGNYLATLSPEIFDKNDQLAMINLSRNRFESLPEGLFKNNKNLTGVWIQESRKLKNLPSGLLSNLTSLSLVYLNGCNLKSLPEDLFKGSINLREILLYENALQSLPDKIFHGLRNLENLQLNDNQIETLSDNIFESCINLKELHVDNNSIVKISRFTFNGLKSLDTLFMQHNKVTKIEIEAFGSLKNVTYINLSHNYISGFEVTHDNKYWMISAFNENSKLKELDLSFNKISLAFKDWILRLPLQMQHLNLSHNAINSLTVNDIDFYHSQLFTLNLSSNKIRTINLHGLEDRFRHHRNKIVLNIENNPVDCDCPLYSFLQYLDGSMMKEMREKLTIQTGPMKCSSPEKYEGTLLSELNSKDYKCVPSKMEIDNYEMCPEGCDLWNRQSDQMAIFNCSYRNLSQAPETLCSLKDKRYFNELDLTGNFIKDIPSFQQIGYDKVKNLLLSHNQISILPEDPISNGTLKLLKLDNNQLSTLPQNLYGELKFFKINVTLGNNPWTCTCGICDLLKYINCPYTTVQDYDNITCENSNLLIGTLTAEDLCQTKINPFIVVASLSVAFLGLTFAALTTFYYRYQQEIKIWLYTKNLCLWLFTEAELDKDKLYDAFISYSHKDENFIINELVANLEKGPRSFKLCIHFRDWLVGEWIPNQIAKSIKESKRTIVVVSRNFIESEWGKMEFRAAHKEGLKEGRARVIVIMYGDIGPIDKLEPELKSYLTMNTYVKWGDPWFWDKLRYALPHKSDMIDNISKCKDVNGPNPIAQLSFNKIEVKQSPESGLSPLNGNAKNLWMSIF